MILSAGSTGTEVNKAVTSYEQRHLPGWRVTLCTLSTKSLIPCTCCGNFPTKGLSILARTLAYPVGMWVSITFIIYGTESCLTLLTLKLIMTMDIHTGHPSVGMISPFQPVGMHIEQ